MLNDNELQKHLDRMAQEAYTAYAQTAFYSAYLDWNQLPERIQTAWYAVAVTVVRNVVELVLATDAQGEKIIQ